MIYELLSHYYNKLFLVFPLEAYAIEPYELHYYLFEYVEQNQTKHLLILEGLDTHEDENSVAITLGRLSEHAGVTVTGWRVLKSAKKDFTKDILTNEEVHGMNLDKVLYYPKVGDFMTLSYAVLEITLDFKRGTYG